MLDGVDCEGAPRDLGLDQGRAFRRRVQAACRVAGVPAGGWLHALGLGAPGAGVADLHRYFPHLAERVAGLARGAGVSRDALAALTVKRLGAHAGATLSGVALAASAGADGPVLAAAFPDPAALVRRRSAPQGGVASLELAPVFGVGGVAGLNQAGLAVLAVAASAEADGAAPGEVQDAPAANAPAALFAQQCLERFERVEAAAEWCLRRPAGGHVTLLLADARGESAAVAVAGSRRRVLRPGEGVLALAPSAARRARLEKAFAELGAPTPAALHALLAREAGAPASGGDSLTVHLRPALGQLAIACGPAGDAGAVTVETLAP